MTRNRGYRRRQTARSKRRVAAYYDGAHAGDPREIGWLSSTRTPCSCWMCGNPRRHRNEATLQERRARLADIEGPEPAQNGLG